MRRYLAPAILFLMIGLGFGPAADSRGLAALQALLGLYGLGTMWWVIVAAKAPPPLWPHVWAVWGPAVLPVGLVAWAHWSADAGGDNAIGIFFVMPWAGVTLLICAAGALTLRINRQEQSRAEP